MDLTSNKYLQQPSTLFSSQVGTTLETNNNGLTKKNPFLDSFSDPFCKMNLKETSDFVKSSFPGANNEISAENGGFFTKRKILEAPLNPGRPIFSFSSNNNNNNNNTNYYNYSRKYFPSKWDDAEKWLVSGGSSCQDSSRMYTKQCSGYKPQMGEVFSEKSRIITEEKVSKVISAFQGPINGVALSATEDVLLLKDKFPNELNQTSPKFGYSQPMQEKFLFGNTVQKSPELLQQHEQVIKHRDIGTEMTPLASSTTSRCPTPFKSTSPARHNTPANRSGPLALTGPDDDTDISQLQDCHLAKLHFGTQFDSVTSNWSSREEEEEEDFSKSLRHFEMSRKSDSELRSCVWEEEEKNKSCLRYQREEAKIQAWVNLQSAKAEAESRKLEVKIQKMRANLEEKLMKRMADVHRKAEEWRATAQFQHSEQVRKAGQQAREATNRRNNNSSSHFSGHKSCGCFPCNKHHI